MGDFFKDIKKEVDSISSIDSSNKAWKSFNNYRALETNSERKNLSLLIPILIGSLLSVLFAGLGYTMHSNYKLQEMVLHLQTVDTVYITKYVNEGNKVTKNEKEITVSRVEYENLIANQENINKLIANERYLENKLNQQNIESSKLTMQLSELQLAFELSLQKESPSTLNTSTKNPNIYSETAVVERENLNPFDVIEVLDVLAFEKENYKIETEVEPVFIPNIRKKTLVDLIIPKSFSVGILGGATFKFKDESVNSPGANVGLTITSLLNKNLRIRAGIDNVYRKVKVVDTDIIKLFPAVTPPLDGTLTYVSFIRNDVFADGGLDLLLRPFGRFRPFVGAGYGYNFNRVSNFQYKYQTVVGELYITREMHQALRDSYVTFTLGSDINISKNFDGIFKLDYFYGLKGTGSWLNINTGLLYHF